MAYNNVSSYEFVDNLDSPWYPGAAGDAALQKVADPDLEQGGNTSIVVRRDPPTGDTTRVLVHRWCPPRTVPAVDLECAGRA